MTGQSLKLARLKRRWTQQRAARYLRVSQGYLSLMEKGHRPVTRTLLKRLLKAYEVPPTALPLLSEGSWASADAEAFARCLGALGYPGFSHLKSRPHRNPAEVLLQALMQSSLDSRVAAGLPWLPFAYPDMDWDWLVRNAKLNDIQNRLGFAVSLARQLAEREHEDPKAAVLRQQEFRLERSRLVREDTFCHGELTEAEKRWLRERRPPEAARWNLLTDLTVERLANVI